MKNLLVVAGVVFAVMGCGKKEGSNEAPKDKPPAPAADKVEAPTPAPAPTPPAPAGSADPVAAAPTGSDSATPAAPVQTDPKALWGELTKPGADVMTIINKYSGGATLSGKIKTLGQAEVFMDIDGTNRVEIKFKDPASAKGLKAGTSITVTCQVGGADAGIKLMTLTDCTKS